MLFEIFLTLGIAIIPFAVMAIMDDIFLYERNMLSRTTKWLWSTVVISMFLGLLFAVVLPPIPIIPQT